MSSIQQQGALRRKREGLQPSATGCSTLGLGAEGGQAVEGGG